MTNAAAQTTDDMIRQYVTERRQARISWELSALNIIGNNPTIDNILESVHDSNADARIMAIQILGYCAETYDPRQKAYIAGEVAKRINDMHANSVGSFQCDEEDFETVAGAAKETLKRLGYMQRQG